MVVRLEMRVDMRRWALVLCSIGVMGGGCSARALISVGFTVRQGQVTGAATIDVEWDGNNVRRVKNVPLVGTTDDPPKAVGVYLDYEGDVRVSAVLLDSDNCEWRAAARNTTAVRGSTTHVVLELARVNDACPAPPDGGAPIAEAGVDAPATNDVHPTLLPDGGAADAVGGEDAAEDGTAKIEACMDYCAVYLKNCAAWRETPLHPGECAGLCRNWPTGSPTSTGENTLACRRTFLTATEDPDLRCSTCIAASPESPGMCNSLPPDFPPRGDCRIPLLPDGGDGP